MLLFIVLDIDIVDELFNGDFYYNILDIINGELVY